MNDTTLGLRIAQRRRMLGLSQEAFGEQMGVSRQAISKWEAGAANPEMEKLVAMSKLFDVSVGWLLGAEDTEQKKETTREEDVELIGKILRTINAPEVASPTPEPELERDGKVDSIPSPRRIDFLQILCAAVSVLSLILCCFCLYTNQTSRKSQMALMTQIEELEQRLGLAETELDGMNRQNAAFLGQLGELSSGMTQLMEEVALLDRDNHQDSSFAVYDSLTKWSLTGEASEDLTKVTIRFSGVASMEVSGVRLVAQQGENLQDYVTCTMDGRNCYGQLELRAMDEYQYFLMIDHTNGTTERIILEGHNLSALRCATSPQVRTVRAQDSIFDNHSSERFWMGWEGVYLSIPKLAPKDAEYLWQALKVSYYHNGEAVESRMLEDKQALEGVDLTKTALFFRIPTCTYQMQSFQEGDLLELRLEGDLRVNGQPVDFSVRLICWEVDDEDLIEIVDD